MIPDLWMGTALQVLWLVGGTVVGITAIGLCITFVQSVIEDLR